MRQVSQANINRREQIRAHIIRMRGKLFQADRRTREGRELAETVEGLEKTFRSLYKQEV